MLKATRKRIHHSYKQSAATPSARGLRGCSGTVCPQLTQRRSLFCRRRKIAHSTRSSTSARTTAGLNNHCPLPIPHDCSGARPATNLLCLLLSRVAHGLWFCALPAVCCPRRLPRSVSHAGSGLSAGRVPSKWLLQALRASAAKEGSPSSDRFTEPTLLVPATFWTTHLPPTAGSHPHNAVLRDQ